MYLFNLIKEINVWRKVKSVAKENETVLNQNGFRVDWVGRIYTVINLPEEVVNQPISREGYVLMKLREYDQLFLNMGIADAVSPEIVELIGADSYLLILSPDRDYIKFIPFVWFLTKTAGLFIILKILYNITVKYYEDISNYVNQILDWII
jgi:hypothetical protein